MTELAHTMAIFEVYPHVVAFYDGRIADFRAYGSAPNWVDDGAISLGICSYALIDGSEALVYDTHTSLAHGRAIRAWLDAAGVTTIRVVLSHWHLDHIAGNEAFADCEIIAHAWTCDALTQHKAAIEAGTLEGPPGIAPLVLPTSTYEDGSTLRVGALDVELRHADVHSRDGTLLYLPQQKLLLAGDTLEDTVTYVAEPDRLDQHLIGLGLLAEIEATRILPNHGSAARIAGGGYSPSLIEATDRYVRRLLRCREDPALAALGLDAFVAAEIEAGWIDYFAPYEEVHRLNVTAVLAAGAS
jgi:glyoxylase-like metal-dependent hydrolase (beta-lactamase superfamily II)